MQTIEAQKIFEGLRVLLVEDQHQTRAMIRQMLSGFGVTQVFEASSGEDAVAFIETACDMLDLVICDWNMAEVSGVDVLKALRDIDMDLPFLMVTGRADHHSVLEAKNLGVSAYISKPFNPIQLEAKVRILGRRIKEH